MMVVTNTFGFFPAPEGPKAPEYPSSSSLYNFGDDSTSRTSEYNARYQEYQKQQDQYQNEQKNFVQDKVVPYARNVFVVWVVLLIAFQVVGLTLTKYGSPLVGAAYAFSGVWAVIFGPIGGLLWFVNSLISSFSSRADQSFTVEPIFQGVGITTLIGVVVMTVLGILFYGQISIPRRQKEAIDPPIEPPIIPPRQPVKPPPTPSLSP
jgi:ABC-type multidrug transport system fused ATPase/permease subunit